MTLIQRAPQGMIEIERDVEEPWITDIRETVASIRAGWLPILLAIVAAAGLVIAMRVTTPAQYTATTQLLIDPGGLQVVDNGVKASGQLGDAGLLVVDSQINVLTSSELLLRIVESEGLDEDPEFIEPSFVGRMIAEVKANIGIHGSGPGDATLTALGALRSHVDVHRVDRSFVLEVGVSSNDREKSVRLANAITATYLELDQAARADATRRASSTLAARLGELGAAARAADDAVQAFRAAHNIVGSSGELVSDRQLTEATSALGAAHARAAEQRARLDQIEAVARGETGLESIAEVVQSPTIAQFRGQLATVQSQLNALTTQNGDRHPAVIEARAQAATLQRQIADEVKRIAAAARNDYERARSNEASLAASLDALKGRAVQVSEDSVQLRELERQAETARTVYQSYLLRTRELDQQQGLYTSASRVISPPTPPASRDGPGLAIMLLAAVAAGAGLGATYAVLRDRIAGRRRYAVAYAAMPVQSVRRNPDGLPPIDSI